MATLQTQGITLYYEVYGDRAKPPVLFVAGLGGTGKSWGAMVEGFGRDHFVILPDQRGTGQTTHAADGYSTVQLAADMASLVEHLAVGPAHVVGASTGGAIGQWMALEHPQTVRTLTLVASFARFDAFTRREFDLRRKLLAESDSRSVYSCYALFLFSPRFAHEHPEHVEAWVEWVAAQPPSPAGREIALKRIDMIAAHDALARLGSVRQPTLVVCGDQDFCTPLPLSEELAGAIPGSELVVFPGAGHLIEHEQQEKLFQTICRFVDRHSNGEGRGQS